MAAAERNAVIQYLDSVKQELPNPQLADGELLKRFLVGQDQAAFAMLVRRHGPMVLGVCRRVLQHEQDAEDAFQATFLVLVRKARSLRSPSTLASWLFGVARRTALEMKTASTKRRAKEASAISQDKSGEDKLADWLPLLDEELARLPQKYREAIVLCDLEGKTRQEAARVLNCAEGTVASRLARGRSMLAARLSRRGVEVSVAVLTPTIVASRASAELLPNLISRTVEAAGLLASGKILGSCVSVKIAVVTEGVLRTMLLRKLQIVAVLFLAILTGLGAAGSMFQSQAAEPPNAGGFEESQVRAKEEAKSDAKSPNKSPLVGIVRNEAGQPLKGAIVLVRGAKPRSGVTSFFPTSYPDSKKHVFTDEKGQFQFANLDPTLTFQLLATAPGYLPMQMDRFVAPDSETASFTLKAHDFDTRDPSLIFKGRIIDEKKSPV